MKRQVLVMKKLVVLSLLVFSFFTLAATESMADQLPAAELNTLYSVQLPDPLGTPPIYYSLISGVLPPGLQLNPWGTVTGEPIALGQYQFTVKSTDADQTTTSWTFDLLVVLAAGNPTTRINGVVRDAATGVPLNNATVTAVGAPQFSAISDSSGAYTMEVPVGTLLLSVVKDGYAPVTIEVIAVAAVPPATYGSVPVASLDRESLPITVGSSGGTFNFTDAKGRVYTLEIPPNAVSAATDIFVTLASSLPSVSERYVTAPIHLGPSGLQFNQPVTLVMPLELPKEPGTVINHGAFNPSFGGWNRSGQLGVVNADGISATITLNGFQSTVVLDVNDFKTANDFNGRLLALQAGGFRHVIVIASDVTTPLTLGVPVELKQNACRMASPIHNESTETRSSTTQWTLSAEANAEIKTGIEFLAEGKLGLKLGGAYGEASTQSNELKVSHDCLPGFCCIITTRWDQKTRTISGSFERLETVIGGIVYLLKLSDFTVQYPQHFSSSGGHDDQCDGTTICEDRDQDSIPDGFDNCPDIPNLGQENSDGDGFGDVCDNCPFVTNPTQANSDTDGFGNACDNCPFYPNPSQADLDTDGIGDDCDPDKDGDGTLNSYDQCPLVPGPEVNFGCPEGIPTLSGWGLGALAALLLAAGSILLRRRRTAIG